MPLNPILADGMEYDQKEVARLISLTFDSNPKVRIATARKLAEINDPGATLAMLELSNDKNKEVVKTANEGLARMRQNKPDMLPMTELFRGVDFSGGRKEEPEHKPMLEAEKEQKEKMLDPLQKEFEKSMGKEKAEQLKPKLFELAFMHKDKSTFQNLLTHVMNLYSVQKDEEKPEAKEERQAHHEKPAQEKQGEPKQGAAQEAPKKEDIGIAEAGFAAPSADAADLIGREAEDMTKDNLFTEEEKKVMEEGEPSIIRMAYDSMMISDDEHLIEHQRDTLKKFLDHQVDVAFKLARRNFKEVKLTDISNIKDGWKNITTDYLLVKKVEHRQYDRTKNAREVYTRLTVADPEGKEGIIYLFENRGALIKEGMSIRLEKAKSKTFKFSGETVLTVDKRGKVYAVF
jgi:hypothetical protein